MAVLTPGSSLPLLSLVDAGGGATAPVAGEALYGFFKTTCPTCQLAWPFFDRIGQRASGGKLSVFAVSQDDPGQTRAFNEQLGVGLPTLFDPEPWPVSEALGIESVPTFLRVAADGKLRETVVGFDRQKLQELAAEAASLSGRPAGGLYQPGEIVPAFKPG